MTAPASPLRARDWVPIVERYAHPDRRRSLQQLAVTVVLFGALYAAMLVIAPRCYPIALLLAVPTACVMVRAFSIQHDCQHGSYFTGRSANELVGRALCVLTLVPNGHHRRLHAIHHAVTGRLDKRVEHPGSFPRTAAD